MNEKKFYDNLWEIKQNNNKETKRDFLHRIFVDKVFNPFDNDRIDVGEKLLRPGERILDLGVWGGTFLNLPGIKSKFSERIGIDVSTKSIEYAQNMGINAIEWNLNNVPYPFENNFFDAITILAVLEHLFDPYEIITEIQRILKPGGELIIALPNIASFSNRIRLLLGKNLVTSDDNGWDGGHLHYFTISETKKLLNNYGF